MDELLVDLQSVRWWFSVVIVGIFVGALSQYFHGFLATRFLVTSTWWRNRQKAKDLEYEGDLQSLRSNPLEVKALESSEQRSHFRSLESLIKSLAWGALAFFSAMIGAPIWILLPLTIIFLVSWNFHIYQSRAAMRAERLLRDLYATEPRDKK